MLGQNHESEVHTDSGLLLVENYYQCPSAVLSGARQQFLEGPEGPYYYINNVNEKVLLLLRPRQSRSIAAVIPSLKKKKLPKVKKGVFADEPK